jgi:heme o synthase
MASPRATAAVPVAAGARARQLAADYLALTKPKVQSLLLFTTVTTMYVAGDPSVELVLLTCLGGYLSAGGAGAVNHYWDRDIDARMARTASRPVPSGRVSPRAALWFGIGLAAAAFALLSLTVNPLAAVLSLSGFAGYVGVYTMWLKRSTPQNIVIGGAAGALPPVVGYSVATGSVTLDSLILFAIIFLWTPPHFWALALVKSGDYARAGVPMMPNVKGANHTRLEIVIYTSILVPVAILPWPMGLGGRLYGAAAIVAGTGMAFMAARVYRLREGSRANKAAMQLFGFSILYLFLLFSALVVEHGFGLIERLGL